MTDAPCPRAARGPGRRIVLDVTSLVTWAGPPVGIIRVVHALATAGQAGAVHPVVHDPAIGGFRDLAPEWAGTILGWSGQVETHEPAPFPRSLLSRQRWVMALERRRLVTRSERLARWADRAQRALLGLRPHRFALLDTGGARIAHVPRDLAFGPPTRLGPDDTLLLAGSAWSYLDGAALRALRRDHPGRIAALCYDLIPITHPRFFAAVDQAMFGEYWRTLPFVADEALVTAAAIGRDLARWCAQIGAPLPPTAIVDLGHDPPAAQPAAALPDGLAPGRYALFVSTIEPRKGHAMLLDAWQALLARGVPQRHGFRLVFVGRRGWMVEGVLRRLSPPPEGVLHLPRCPDAVLAALYRHAGFACYPSVYEGYGLPLVEAFARGTAMLVSSGGALAETAHGLAPCLDPGATQDWADAMERWIAQPEERARQAEHVRRHFRHPTWPEAVSVILGLLREGVARPVDARLARPAD